MPAELLEAPVEVEEVSREVSETEPRAMKRSEEKPVSPKRPETLRERIFKGHDEFLGWTPD